MSKMDRGFCRCTGFTIRRCLGCHFAAVAADKCKFCVQYKRAGGRNHPRKVDLRGHFSRCNPAGIRAYSRNFQAWLALRSRLWPRHYRASLCSDAATFGSAKTIREAVVCLTAFAAARLTWVFVIVVNLALVLVLEPFKRLFRPSDCRYSTR